VTINISSFASVEVA